MLFEGSATVVTGIASSLRLSELKTRRVIVLPSPSVRLKLPSPSSSAERNTDVASVVALIGLPEASSICTPSTVQQPSASTEIVGV